MGERPKYQVEDPDQVCACRHERRFHRGPGGGCTFGACICTEFAPYILRAHVTHLAKSDEPPQRIVSVPLSLGEFMAVQAAAEKADMFPSQYIRDAALQRAAEVSPVRPDEWHPSDEVRVLRAILAELKEMHSFLLARADDELEVAQ